MFAGLSVATCD